MLQSLLRAVGPNSPVLGVHLNHLLVRTERVKNVAFGQRLHVVTAAVRHLPKLAACGPFDGHHFTLTAMVGNENHELRWSEAEMLIEEVDGSLLGARCPRRNENLDGGSHTGELIG